MMGLFECRVCGACVIEERGAFETCSVCGWEDDGTEDGIFYLEGADGEHLELWGPNGITTTEARHAWKLRSAP